MINRRSRKTFVDKGSIRTTETTMSPIDVRDHYEKLREAGELFTKSEIVKALSHLLNEDDVELAMKGFSKKRRFMDLLSTGECEQKS